MARNRGRISPAARQLIEDGRNRLWLSVISAWELHLKYAAGKLDLPTPPSTFVLGMRVEYGIDQLDLREADLVPLEGLPWHHHDPFDRALLAQSIARGFVLVTPDALLSRYKKAQVLW